MPPSASRPSPPASILQGGLRLTLRLEGFLLLVVAVFVYFQARLGGARFAWCFLVPDLSLLGYLAGARIGARAYNVAHSTIGPLVLGLAGLALAPALLPYALIWLAHIGFDRALGYGLKYEAGFALTHLGRIGRA